MKVTISNFQSLASASLDVEGLTVIVGPSDLGKSALVRAIEGSLFNKAGDFFVRKGAPYAEVALAGVPASAGPPLDVVWRKGKGRNEFVVNGERYDKVGMDAPPPLPAAGYRDVGEDIRPQIASQFDRPFLLDRPGSVVADVLTALSRVVVVTAADRLCASDVREAKRLESIRRADLLEVDQQVVETAAVDVLHGRMVLLRQHAEAAAALESRVAHVRDAAARRAALRGVAQVQLPAQTDTSQALAQGRVLAAATPLVAFRSALTRVVAPLPPVTATTSVEASGERWLCLRGLVADRKRLLAVRGAKLPEGASPARYSQLLQWAQQTASLRDLVAARRQALSRVFTTQAAARAASVEEQATQTAFDLVLSETGACPLCGRVS